MKKLSKILLTTTAVVASALAMTGCGSSTSYVANPVTGADDEQYGYCISKTASKHDEILAAMNKVIAEADMDNIVTYFTELSNGTTPSVTIKEVDLSDNTAGTINAYTNSGFEPYEYFYNSDLTGVDIYMMRLVCEELNMKLEFHDVDFDGIVGKVATEDNAVGAAGITITDDRKTQVDFSDPYFSSVQYIISSKAKNYTSLSDLKGLKIGVQKGTTGSLMVEEEIKSGSLKDSGATFVEYDNGPLAFAAMKQGKIDVIVIDELPAKKLVA